MVMWRWENKLLNEKLELEPENAAGYVLLLSSIYGNDTMAIYVSARILNSRPRKGV
jgi:hypothetical protein